MARTTSLMEWAEQTRRLCKQVDYFSLQVVDIILDNLWLLDHKALGKYKQYFTNLCQTYHKPNPFYYLADKRKVEEEFRRAHGGQSLHQWQQDLCRSENIYKVPCRMFRHCTKLLTDLILLQIERTMKAREVINYQIFEIVDFISERVELVDPNIMSDEYLMNMIGSVCKEHRKINPFTTSLRHRMGRYWKDKQGHWHKERRKRF